MKRVFLLCVLVMNPFYLQASVMGQIKVNPKISAILQQAMINHLDQVDLTLAQKENTITHLQTINENLKFVDQANIQAFLFSEFFKSFHQFANSPEHQVKAYISNSNLIAAKEKLNQYKSLYTDFAKFHIQDQIKNFEPLVKDNVLNNYKNITKREQIKEEQRERIQLLNKHVGPWIMQFMRLKSEQFNAMCTQHILRYFENMANVSRFFKKSIPTQTENILFILPDQSTLETLTEPAPTASKEEALIQNSPKDVEDLEVEPSEAAGEEINKLMDKVDKTPE
ncbi:MAG: hypothetical protein CME62_08305 [Halobacteriovoraceae bacterium]|nr:hypothetical protein [Halobacteriovoraceae bacterium]|tara:strand:- start:9872 stop:10717 length:846 start_codon:yes stop_codon:yes gene_type:complete